MYATVSGWAVSPAHSLGVGVKWGRQKGRGPGLVAPGCVSVGGRLVVMWSGGKGSFWSEGSSGARGRSGCRGASGRGSGWDARGSASPVRCLGLAVESRAGPLTCRYLVVEDVLLQGGVA